PGESWGNLNTCLRSGKRGLPQGLSLARLLAPKRGKRRLKPPLSVAQIVHWADAHHKRTGRWPTQISGPIPRQGQTWVSVDNALLKGYRELPGGSSLAELLAEKRGVRKWKSSALTIDQILAWADAHFKRLGYWPKLSSGDVFGVRSENWGNI